MAYRSANKSVNKKFPFNKHLNLWAVERFVLFISSTIDTCKREVVMMMIAPNSLVRQKERTRESRRKEWEQEKDRTDRNSDARCGRSWRPHFMSKVKTYMTLISTEMVL